MIFCPSFLEEFLLLDEIPHFVVLVHLRFGNFLAETFLGNSLMFTHFCFSFMYRYYWIQSKKQDRYSYVSSSLSTKANGKNKNN